MRGMAIKLFLLVMVMVSLTRGLRWPNRPLCSIRSLKMTNDDLQGLTVVELKEKLKQHGLAVSGAKSVLISRLQEHEASAIDAKSISNAVTGVKSDAVTTKSKTKIATITTTTRIDIVDELEALMHEGELILNKKNNYNPSTSSTHSTHSNSNSHSNSNFRDTKKSDSNSDTLTRIEELVAERYEHRFNRRYDEADAIREELRTLYQVEIKDKDGEWHGPNGLSGPLNPSIKSRMQKLGGKVSIDKYKARQLVYDRTLARRNRNFSLADELREQLLDAGVELMDKLDMFRAIDGSFQGYQSQSPDEAEDV